MGDTEPMIAEGIFRGKGAMVIAYFMVVITGHIRSCLLGLIPAVHMQF
jgi:hypothetical protein